MAPTVDVRALDLDTLAEPGDLRDRVRQMVPKFKALADENRLTVMLLLAQSPRTVRELTDASGLNQTLISHHLAFLREHELVAVTPRGRANIYRICCDELAAPLQLLAGLATLTPEGASACCAEPPPPHLNTRPARP